MASTPPLLPEEAYYRVLRLARFDGMGVLTVAGLFALLSALVGDRLGALIGLLISASGAIELHGATLLQHGERRGMTWLVTSQLFLMFTILGYCEFRLVDVDTLLRLIHADANFATSSAMQELKRQAAMTGRTVDEYIRLGNRVIFTLVALVTLIYQGAMTLYYARRRRAVIQALQQLD